MKTEQHQRIENMENAYNEMSHALQNLEAALDNWKEKMPLYEDIVNIIWAKIGEKIMRHLS